MEVRHVDAGKGGRLVAYVASVLYEQVCGIESRVKISHWRQESRLDVVLAQGLVAVLKFNQKE